MKFDHLRAAGIRRTNQASSTLKVDWLYKNLIPSRGFGVLTGGSGIGKSALSVELAVAVATATPFAGHDYDNRKAGEYETQDGEKTGLLKPSGVLLIDGEGQTTSSWLTIDRIYVVLTIEIKRGAQWMFRLVGDGKSGVALFPMESFEVVSPTVASTWIAS